MIFTRAVRRGQISISDVLYDIMFSAKKQNNEFVILQIFFVTFCTFVVDVNTEKNAN